MSIQGSYLLLGILLSIQYLVIKSSKASDLKLLIYMLLSTTVTVISLEVYDFSTSFYSFIACNTLYVAIELIHLE